jgi:hypothetical protein
MSGWEAPSSKFQAPEKLQIECLNPAGETDQRQPRWRVEPAFHAVLGLGAWSFSGAWSLELAFSLLKMPRTSSTNFDHAMKLLAGLVGALRMYNKRPCSSQAQLALQCSVRY